MPRNGAANFAKSRVPKSNQKLFSCCLGWGNVLWVGNGIAGFGVGRVGFCRGSDGSAASKRGGGGRGCRRRARSEGVPGDADGASARSEAGEPLQGGENRWGGVHRQGSGGGERGLGDGVGPGARHFRSGDPRPGGAHGVWRAIAGLHAHLHRFGAGADARARRQCAPGAPAGGDAGDDQPPRHADRGGRRDVVRPAVAEADRGSGRGDDDRRRGHLDRSLPRGVEPDRG